jgi:hypothetical protein
LTAPQKFVLGLLAGAALLVLSALGCMLAFWLVETPRYSSAAVPASSTPLPTPAPTSALNLPAPQPTATLIPTLSPTPAPTATGTRVVVGPAPTTPTPTRANCINQISNFEASNVLTSNEVRVFLSSEIPAHHLDNCRGIEYHHQLAAVHGVAILGNFDKVYREINVYPLKLQGQQEQDILDTLTHEIGHNVYFNLWREDFEFDGRWSRIFRAAKEQYATGGSGFVSGYAQSNHYEDFAESYLAYVRYPDRLRAVSQEKYEFMRIKVFLGREYEP